jgi:hypothetical protein
VEHGTTQQPERASRIRRWGWTRSAALVGGGLVAGGIVAGTLSANAATDDKTTTSPTQGDSTAAQGPGRGDEQPLTGDTATSVTDAVLAEYPAATIERVETDSEGVYEAHIVTTDDQHLTVELDEAFAITGTETHGDGHGFGDGDGDGPGRGHGHHGDGSHDGDSDDTGSDNSGSDGNGSQDADPTT